MTTTALLLGVLSKAALEMGPSARDAIDVYLAQGSWTGVTRTVKFGPDEDLAGGAASITQTQAGAAVRVGTSG